MYFQASIAATYLALGMVPVVVDAQSSTYKFVFRSEYQRENATDFCTAQTSHFDSSQKLNPENAGTATPAKRSHLPQKASL